MSQSELYMKKNGNTVTCFNRGDELKELTSSGTATFVCPKGCYKDGGSAYGSDPFSMDSRVCTAAIVAGKIKDGGGQVA